MADGYSGLQAIDVSDPLSPVIIGAVDTPGESTGIAAHGTVAYLADNTVALQLIDVSSCRCRADRTGDRMVDVDDLHNVLLDWNSDGSDHNGDVDGSGVVDVDDLLGVILSWGPCE